MVFSMGFMASLASFAGMMSLRSMSFTSSSMSVLSSANASWSAETRSRVAWGVSTATWEPPPLSPAPNGLKMAWIYSTVASWWLRMFVQASRHCLAEDSSWADQSAGMSVLTLMSMLMLTVWRVSGWARRGMCSVIHVHVVGKGSGMFAPAPPRPSRQLTPALAPAQHATLHLGSKRAASKQRTHLFQHDLGIFEVIEHGLDVGLVGGPGHKAPGDSLHALHGARRQQLRAPRASRSARADKEKKKSGERVAQRRQ
jgi:hypothetical protein